MTGTFFRIRKNVKIKIKKGERTLLLKKPFQVMIEIIKMIKLTMLTKSISENYNLEGLVDFTFSPRNSIIKLHQIRYEISSLLFFIRKYNPKIILEIGTLNGGTLFLFSRIANKDALLISIDLPKYKLGRFQFDWRVPLIKKFSLSHQKLRLIRANSHKISTLNHVKKFLKGQKIDFLFIDADHTYNGVKKDFEMYSPLVKDGGLIAFHDIVSPSSLLNNVHKFWKEIKEKFDGKEFIANDDQDFGGIGVLKK